MYNLEKPMHFNEIKKFLGVGYDFLYKKLQSGELTGFKLAGKWVVYPSDLRKYLDKQPSNRKRIRRVI